MKASAKAERGKNLSCGYSVTGYTEQWMQCSTGPAPKTWPMAWSYYVVSKWPAGFQKRLANQRIPSANNAHLLRSTIAERLRPARGTSQTHQQALPPAGARLLRVKRRSLASPKPSNAGGVLRTAHEYVSTEYWVRPRLGLSNPAVHQSVVNSDDVPTEYTVRRTKGVLRTMCL